MRNRGAPTKGKKKRITELGLPHTAQHRLFCERWLIHFDTERAWREAGFKGHTSRAAAMLGRFADYLRPLREAKAKVMAQRLAVSAEQVVEGMTERTFFDAGSFIERAESPMTETVTVGRKKIERTVTWDGRPVYAERFKPYSELTPEQRKVVEITSATGDRIHYRLPSIHEQYTYLTALGRQFGLFAEKLIVERHNHQHVHHNLEFTNVSSTKLNAITRQLLPLVGLEFAQTLGYTAEDIEAAARDEGVVMTVPQAKAPA